MENENIIHEYQEEPGLCGIACWCMILNTLGLNVRQFYLKKFMSNPDWGTSHEDHAKIADNYFSEYQSREGWSLEELRIKLDNGHMVICNVWDDYKTFDNDPADGHYVVITEVNNDRRMVTILDPSKSERVNSRSGEYEVSFDEFNNHWYDYLDEEKTQRTEHWAICINPKSLKPDFRILVP